MSFLHKQTGSLGFLTVFVIAVIGLLILMPMVFSPAQKIKHQKTSLALSEYQAIDRIIFNEVIRTLGRFFEFDVHFGGGCTNAQPTIAAMFPIATDVAGFSLSHLVNTTVFTYIGNRAYEDARSRCDNNQTLAATASLAGKTNIYFCLLVDPLGNLRLSRIFEAGTLVFAEVSFALKDFESNADIACENYLSANLRGGLMFYSIYWQKDVGREQRYFMHSGSGKILTKP